MGTPVVLVDTGYRNEKFYQSVCTLLGARIDKEFAVVAKQWVVERTFAWFNLYRRLSKDYELLPEVSELAVYCVMISLTLR